SASAVRDEHVFPTHRARAHDRAAATAPSARSDKPSLRSPGISCRPLLGLLGLKVRHVAGEESGQQRQYVERKRIRLLHSDLSRLLEAACDRNGLWISR